MPGAPFVASSGFLEDLGRCERSRQLLLYIYIYANVVVALEVDQQTKTHGTRGAEQRSPFPRAKPTRLEWDKLRSVENLSHLCMNGVEQRSTDTGGKRVWL